MISLKPPFPGAYPGPVVDDTPTWGAYLRDVPDEGYQTRTNDGPVWVDRGGVLSDGSMWVLVRRTPQPTTETEVIPWHQAASRTLYHGGRCVMCTRVEWYGPGAVPRCWYVEGSTEAYAFPDADGLIAVLVEGGETEP